MSKGEKKMVVLMELIPAAWAAETSFQCPVGGIFLFYLPVWACVSSFHTPSGQYFSPLLQGGWMQMPPHRILQQYRDKDII